MLVLNDDESLTDVLVLADSLLLMLVLTDNESQIDVLVLVDCTVAYTCATTKACRITRT